MSQACKPRWTLAFPRSLDSVSRDVEHAFEQLVNGQGFRGFSAPTNLWEDSDAWRVEIELPGFKQEQIDLTLEKNQLRVAAERSAPEAERKYWHQERGYGRVERVITLPETVDTDSIDAELRDGILQLTFKKKAEAQPRKISVKGA
jgi:HSP20 family protein